MSDQAIVASQGETVNGVEEEPLARLLASPVGSIPLEAGPVRIEGVVVGRLVGFAGEGATPLVTYRQQPGSAAMPARATLDLHGAHVGRDVVLMFEDADPGRPIIMGCLRSSRAALPRSSNVEVDADGERLVVSAGEQIVLRCGKASITLTRDGKVIIRGAYVSNHSSGVLRIKGGSVQIN
jgi:hypothetical protein